MRDITLTHESLDDLLRRRRPENPKLHDLDGIDQSLDRFGFVTPVVINERDEMLLEGHGRIETLARLYRRGGSPPAGIQVSAEGTWMVPVARGASLSPEDAKAFLIAANRLVESGDWDQVRLTALLSELEATQSGLAGVGFSTDELNDLLAQLNLPPSGAAPDDPDEAPPIPTRQETWVQPGDVFRLGEHILACADCRTPGLLKELLGARLASTLWTDPPFGVQYAGRTKRRLTIANDGAEDLAGLLPAAFTAVDAILQPGGRAYVAHPAGPQIIDFIQAILDVGWQFRQDLVWWKGSVVLSHSDYLFQHEPVAYCIKPGPGRFGRGGKGWYGDNSASTVFEIPRPRRSDKHPTMKPVALVAAMLRNSTRRGDTVVDPFLGSGTTLIACEQLGRMCVGVELDPGYVQVTIQRWQQLTGLRADKVLGA